MGKYRPAAPNMRRMRCAHSGLIVNGKMLGGSVVCPRVSLLREHGIQAPIDDRAKATFAIGHVNEQLFKESVEKTGKDFQEEDVFIFDVDPEVELIMAADFIVEGVPYELKSVSSTRAYKKIFIEGNYKVENTAQLVQEMIELERPMGVLRYTNFVYHSEYKKPDLRTMKSLARKVGKATDLAEANELGKQMASMIAETWKAAAGQVKRFVIRIDEEGNILVDGKKSGYHVSHVLEHRQVTIDCLKHNQVYHARPAEVDGFSPCNLCSWADACDKFDGQFISTTEEFLNEAKKALTIKPE